MDLETLQVEIQQIDRRLAEIEAHQWTANGRLRQDTAGLTHDVGIVALILLAQWAGLEFHWWYVPAIGFIGVFGRSYAVDRAWEQEQTRFGAMRRK